MTDSKKSGQDTFTVRDRSRSWSATGDIKIPIPKVKPSQPYDPGTQDTAKGIPYQFIFRYSMDALLVIDVFGKILDMNPQARQILGTDPGNVIREYRFRRLTGNGLNEPGEGGNFPGVGYSEKQIFEFRDRFGTWHSRGCDSRILRPDGGSDVYTLVRLTDDLQGSQRDHSSVNGEGKTVESFFLRMFRIFQNNNVLNTPAEGPFADLLEEKLKSFRFMYRCIRSYSLIEQYTGIQSERLDLKSWLSDLFSELGDSVKETTELSIDLSYDLPEIMGHTESIRELIRSVINNSEESFRDGGRIKIAAASAYSETTPILHRNYEKGLFACLKISDNGSGMDIRSAEHAFDAFQSSKDPSQHSGLGLTICRSVMHAHRGYIEIHSHPGKGTQVFCYFPAAGPADIVHEEQSEYRFPGSIHMIMDNPKLCRKLHLDLGSRKIRANYSTLLHEFIHLREQKAIRPRAVILSPALLNRATPSQLDYMADLNREIPYIFIRSVTERLSGALEPEFPYSAEIPYPFTVTDIIKSLQTIFGEPLTRVQAEDRSKDGRQAGIRG